MIKNSGKQDIAAAAEEALKVIANAAAEALKVTKNANGNDHDLLQRLDEKVDSIILQIKEINDGTANRINKLEQEKLNSKDSYLIIYKADVDKRLDDLENKTDAQGTVITKIWSYGIAIIFAVGVVEFLLSTFLRSRV